MDVLDRIRTAIYESEKYTEEEKIILFEAVNEGKEDVNKVYLEAFKKTLFEYRDDIKDVKKMIKEKKLSDAYKKLNKTRDKLNDIEKTVNDLPSDLPSTAVSKLLPIVVSSLVSFGVFKALEPVIREKETTLKKKLIEMQKVLPEEKRTIKSAEPTFKSNLSQTLIENLALQGVMDGFEAMTGKDVIKDGNTFKKMSLKRIKKEKQILDKLEKKIKEYC